MLIVNPPWWATSANNLRPQMIPKLGRYPGNVAETRWLDEDEQHAWRTRVGVIGRLLARLDAELQRGNDITLPDYELLVHLSEAPEQALRMAELAERLLLSPSGLTRRLD